MIRLDTIEIKKTYVNLEYVEKLLSVIEDFNNRCMNAKDKNYKEKAVSMKTFFTNTVIQFENTIKATK